MSIKRFFKNHKAFAHTAAASVITAAVIAAVILFNAGFSALAEFYRAFLRVFEDDRRYFRLIRELDSYFLRDAESKEEYEDIIFLYFHRFQRAYERGLADGTVRKLEKPGVFYYASCHSLLNLCKALSADTLLRQDETPHPEFEVAALIDMILYNLVP